MPIAHLVVDFTDATATLRFESNTEKRNGEKWAVDIELVEVEVWGRKYDKTEFGGEFGKAAWAHFEAMHENIGDWYT